MKEIGIETGPVAFTSAGIKAPKIGVEGKFSLWFLAALALSEGEVTLEKFTDEKVNDPKLIELRQKINARLVRELKLGAKVRVKMKNGETYEGFRKTPKGDPANPLSIEEISNKFRSTAKISVHEDNVEPLVRRIKTFEDLCNMEEIFDLSAPE